MTTVIAAALLLLGLGLFYGSGLLPEALDPNDVGAAGFPRLVAVVMMVFAVPLIVQTLRTAEANRAVGRTHPRTLLFMLLTLVHAAAIPFETATVACTLSGGDGLGDRQAILVDVVSGDPSIRDGEV